MDPIELVAHRRQTDRFIRVDPVQVQFLRTTRTKNNAGGFDTSEPVLLDPQEVRLLTLSTRAAVERKTEAGTLVLATVQLMGRYPLDVQRGDRFLRGVEEQLYEVLFVYEPQLYQTKADLYYRGVDESG